MKILYVHNKLMWYRLPYFNGISQLYDVTFVFTDEERVEGLIAESHLLKSVGKRVFRFTPGLAWLLIRGEYDLLVFPSIASSYSDLLMSYVIVKLRRKPYIWGSDRWYIPPEKTFLRRIVDRLRDGFLGAIARNASGYYVPGPKHHDFAGYLGVSESRIFLIPNASAMRSDENEIAGAREIVKRLGVEHKKVLLFVGRLMDIKGLEYLLRAVALLKERRDDLFLIVVGDNYFEKANKGRAVEKYRALCRDLGIEEQVFFTGEIAREHIARYYILSNVLILPSVTYGKFGEAWGLVLNEAMSFGKPVIATTAVGGAHALIRDGVNGYVVQEKDVVELSRCIERIAEDPDLERDMGMQSREIIRSGFTYEHMVSGFQMMVDQVLRERSAGG